MRKTLASKASFVEELFRGWDHDQDGAISKAEFRKAMPVIGIRAERSMVDKLFDHFDEQGTGELTLPALRAKLRPPKLSKVTEQKLKEQKIRRTSKEILLAAAGDAAPAAAGDAAPAAASLGAGPPEACRS
eukprot:Transcript_2650.p4 GENE.Transcript_2650~~Transcript_2650.p4  ORF type:complete len:131 (-),score=64.13 Transcript_2650:87-479(-)